MAGQQHLISIGIDWTQSAADTKVFLDSIQAEIDKLVASGTSGAASPIGVGNIGAQLKADVQSVVSLLKTARIPIPKELTDLLNGGLLRQLQAIKFPNFTPARSNASLGNAFAATTGNVAAAGVVAGTGASGAPQMTPAEAQAEKARQTRLLAADSEYIEATVELAAAYKQLEANVAAEKAVDDEYLKQTLRAAENRNFLNAIEDERKSVDANYLASVVLATTSNNRRVAAEQRELAADQAFLDSVVQGAISKEELSAAQLRELAASGAYLVSYEEGVTAKLELANAQRLELLGSQANLEATAEDTISKLNLQTSQKATLVASNEYKLALERAALVQDQLTALQEATGFKKVPTSGSSAGGNTPTGPGGFLGGLGKFGGGDVGAGLGSRFASSAAFFASGFVLFGVINQIREAIKATGELQKEFNVIQTLMNQFGEDDQFEHVKQQVLDLSVATATSAAEVARVERQLAGVFANPQTGAPNFDRAGVETKSALEFAQVTGTSFKEIVDDFSAISVSFKTDKDGVVEGFKEIANTALNLSQQLGVPDKDILKFTSDLAPLGASLGFTATQLASLGAVIEQTSGRSASGLGEQLGRSLSALQSKFPELIQLFGNNPATAPVVKSLGQAFGEGDTPGILKILVENYGKLNQAQKENLALIVGGRREAGTFYALLDHGALALKALNEQFDNPKDTLDKRFKAATESITFQFEQAKLAVQRFLIVLLDSGIADAIGSIAGALITVADALSLIIGFAQPINDLFGGWPLKIASLAAEVFVLVKAFAALQKIVLATNVGKALFANAAASQAAGGAGAAGVLASPGPLLAVVASVFALNQLKGAIDQRGEVAQAGGGVTQAALEQLSKGVSIDEIRRRAASGEPTGLAATGADLYNNIFRQKDTSALITDADQIYKNPSKIAALTAIKDKQGDINATVGLQGRKRLSALITDLTEHPEADDLNKFADALIAQQTDPDTQKAIHDAVANVAVQQKYGEQQAARLQSTFDPKHQQAIDDLLQDFQSGRGGSSALVTALQGQLNVLNQGLTAASGKDPNDPEFQKLRATRDKVQQTLDAVLKQRLLAPLQLATKLADETGRGNTQAEINQTLASITGIAQQLSAQKALDPGTEQDLIFQALDLLKQHRKQQADAAISALDKDKILNQPIPIPAEIQKLIVDLQLRSGPAADTVDEFATFTGKTVDAARSAIAQMFVTFGGNVGKIRDAIQNGEIAFARQSVNSALEFYNKVKGIFLLEDIGAGMVERAINTYKDIITRINKQRGKGTGTLDSIGNAPDPLGDINAPPTIGPDPGDVTAKAKDDRAEAQAQENARLDILAAQANGDTVKLAQIARDRAQVEDNFATSLSQHLEAMAHMVEADNQMAKALAGQRHLLRDIDVASHNNDPIFAAVTALSQAEDDFANAANPEDQGAALIALMNAQHAAAKALLDAADAFTNLDIAKANLAGDPVTAARKRLEELQRRLENASALGLNPEDIANLQTQITDATAQLAQTQISHAEQQINNSLELGRINKGQAIAQLEALKAFAKNQDEIDQIDLEVKRLRDSLGQDFKFNLPSVLGLPTLYEARRLNQTGSGASGGGYQDNRVVTNTVYIDARGLSQDQLSSALQGAIGPSRVYSTQARKY